MPVNEWTNHGDYLKALVFELSYLPLMVLAAFSTLNFFIPKFIYQYRYKSFFLSYALFLICIAFLQRVLQFYFIYPLVFKSPMENFGGLFVPYRLLQNMVIIAVPVFASSFIKLFFDWNEARKKAFALEQEKLQTEFGLLKAQLKPHFLFNNLNNIYGLALAKSDKAAKLILKLSDLLSYSLYETSEKEIALSKEVEAIKSFIELEEIRFAERLKLELNYQGDFASKKISPMVLLTFVENAFTHASNNERAELRIELEVILAEDELMFRIKNSISDNFVQKEQDGIGLKHTKKILRELYKDKHSLNIEHLEHSYELKLKVRLS